MAGKKSSARDDIEGFVKKVEEYSSSVGLLPPDERAVRVEYYMTCGPDDLEEMSENDLGKACTDMQQYAVHLQKVLNVQRVKVARCKHKITTLVEPLLGEYSAFKTEDKRLAATLEHDVALEYYEMQKGSEAVIQRWDWYGQRLDGLIKAMTSLSYSKRS